jgi:hypothetical protein
VKIVLRLDANIYIASVVDVKELGIVQQIVNTKIGMNIKNGVGTSHINSFFLLFF